MQGAYQLYINQHASIAALVAQLRISPWPSSSSGARIVGRMGIVQVHGGCEAKTCLSAVGGKSSGNGTCSVWVVLSWVGVNVTFVPLGCTMAVPEVGDSCGVHLGDGKLAVFPGKSAKCRRVCDVQWRAGSSKSMCV